MELVRRVGVALVSMGLLGVTLGCGGDARPVPTELIDGSLAQPPPIVLEGVREPTLQTVVHRTTVGMARMGSRATSCLAPYVEDHRGGSVVERIGASGSSVTLVTRQGHVARACDAVDGAWCGRAFGRLDQGRLPDPRLSLTCREPSGRPVGFAWIQPVSAARYVVVHGPGYAEVYRTFAGQPVRVTTLEADLVTSDATFAVSEHGGDGRRLGAYELDAHVAG
jgi:hypothetical protein